MQYLNLVSPRRVKEDLPVGNAVTLEIAKSRNEIRRILFGDDERFLIVAGPCSVHDMSSCIEYAERLASLQKKYSSLFYIVMRCYLEKSRTALGWGGFVSSPNVDGCFDVKEGLRRGREFLLSVAKLGLAIAYEVVDPLVFPYFDDLISWASIGARSARSQLYRVVASAYQFPFAFKNTLEGDLMASCNAILTSRSPHSFLTINDEGFISSCCTQGNPYSHLVLRGFRNGELSFKNYDNETLKDANKLLVEMGLNPIVLVDASHDNSSRKPEIQEAVFFDVLKMRYGQAKVIAEKAGADISKMIRGVMLESFIEEGSISEMEFRRTKQKGVSITDACMSWERTERIISQAYEVYKDAKKETKVEEIEKAEIASAKKIEIYTDGACSGNPGKGGWGFVLVANGRIIIEKSGFDAETTNNRMEMQAVIKALEEVKKGIFSNSQFTLFTDSSYVKNGITQWIKKWKQNGWKSSSKAPVKNQDLWRLLDSLASHFATSLSWKWVKGHAGNKFNEICDRLASEQAQRGRDEKGQHSLF